MSRPTNKVLGRDDLIAAYYTLSGAPVGKPARFSFEQRVEAAAAAGFSAIGLHGGDYAACRKAGLSDVQLRAVVDGQGIHIAELEFLANWLGDGEEGARAGAREERVYAAADAFGARHMNVGTVIAPGMLPPLEVAAERFAALCDRAAQHNLLVALEFLPWTAIPDAATAWEIAGLAGRSNGGVLVDSWHYFRGAADPAQLRAVPAERIFVIQFNDADKVPVGALQEDTMRRRLPGEGAFDLVGFIQLLDTMGVQAPLSVEIISAEQQARPVAEAARLAHDTTRTVLTGARSEPAR